ncbi:MAG: S-adenosylmethionine:tRNA ribosyltransferase-isomerase [Porphyromonadaceae bacterium]|nr:S-adenosylmethionine:tRNA ribosyltransferase-isomerase [Porphyromonadaceae bacterium]
MQKPQDIFLSEYDYSLPEERIAKYPLARRDASKLLLFRGGEISSSTFDQLPRFLPDDTLLICNNTRVIQARLHFHKESGAIIEIFCLEPLDPCDYLLSFQTTGCCVWHCLVGNLRRWKAGRLSRTLQVEGKEVTLQVERRNPVPGETQEIVFRWDGEGVTFASLLEVFGELPIPPYLNRATEESDKITYQTLYSHIEGSVAAPTAGLHFTPEVFTALQERGIPCQELTLHVGAGTFKPVKSETIAGHEMHTEYLSVPRDLLALLAVTPRRVVAVGTTSVRTLESLYYMGCTVLQNPEATPAQLVVEQWRPYEEGPDISVGEALSALVAYLDCHNLDRLVSATRMIIVPGFRWRIVQGLITNFHQPRSTLLLLVSSFVKGRWREIYEYALANGFRFLSYGDSSLLLP